LDGAIVSNEYLTAIDSDKLLTEFLTILASLPAMRQKFFLSSYGVDIEKLFFDANDWKNRSVMLPGVQEQCLIAQVFRNLDELISFHCRKHERLQALKLAMLQKMFPQPGSSFPEVRFGGFSGPWESKALGKLGQPYAGIFGKTKEDFGHGDARFVTYMGVFSNPVSGPDATEAIEVDKSQNKVKKGDVMFTISSETPEEVGMSSVWSGDEENTYLNSFCFGFRPLESLRSEFLAYVLRASAFRSRVRVLAQGISRYNISKAKVMNIPVSIPTEEEQERIPFDIDSHITEIDTGKIDADYMNSRFAKYLKELQSGDGLSIESTLAELHRSFTSLSQEDQKFAEIFLHDIQRGDVQIDPERTFRDYLVDYKARAKNRDFEAIVATLGVDAAKLAVLLNAHVTEVNLNEYGRFDDLRETVDEEKAKAYFDQIEGKPLPMFKIKIRAAKVLTDFLVRGVLSLNVTESDTSNSVGSNQI
jgi:hypothetical protein